MATQARVKSGAAAGLEAFQKQHFLQVMAFSFVTAAAGQASVFLVQLVPRSFAWLVLSLSMASFSHQPVYSTSWAHALVVPSV